MHEQRRGGCDDNKVGHQLASDGTTSHVKLDSAQLLLERAIPLLLDFGLCLPEHRVGRDGRSQERHGTADAGKVEPQLRHKGAHQHRPPIGMGEEGSQDVGDEHKAHGEKDLFEGLEVAIGRQVPQR